MAQRVRILGLEGSANGVVVQSQFNPKEISIDKAVPWQRQKKAGPADLEFTAAEPKTLSCELLFDLFEAGQSVQPQVSKLQQLSDVDAALKRPPKVRVICGAEGSAGMIPPFEGVIESVSVKYTMLDGNGLPVRATVGLRFLEARNLAAGNPAGRRKSRA